MEEVTTSPTAGGKPDPRLDAEKAALRQLMRGRRAALGSAERDAWSQAICRSVVELLDARAARVVLTFLSFGSEVSTVGLVDHLAGAGSRVLLPLVRDGALFAADYRPGDALMASAYGPLEPVPERPADPVDLEAVVLPGLAFDRRGVRLGYGGGYFDRFLAPLSPRPLLVAVGFALQVLPEVPGGPHDVPVDFVVTEREVIPCTHGPEVAATVH
jgi:5-formyltetrahydrofolate cyclo-ligase